MKPLEPIDKLNRLTESHGALEPGKGMISGIIALALAMVGDCVPNGFLKQLAFPFRWKGS